MRELGVDRTEAQRAVKIASIAPDAKEAARAAGLDDNQAALLAVARAPAEQQMQKVEQITRERSARRQRRAEGEQQPAAVAPDRHTEADMPLQLSHRAADRAPLLVRNGLFAVGSPEMERNILGHTWYPHRCAYLTKLPLIKPMLYDRPSSPRKLADLLGSMIEILDGVFERSLRAPLHTAEDVQSPDREPLESTEVV